MVQYQQAYQAFVGLSALSQRVFLNQVYFNELQQTAVKGGLSYKEYSRGYEAVNTLFPASLGYTANNLGCGSNGANAPTGSPAPPVRSRRAAAAASRRL